MVAPHFGNVKYFFCHLLPRPARCTVAFCDNIARYTAAGAQKDKGYTLFVLQRKPGQSA
jgi:hypothetical protein